MFHDRDDKVHRGFHIIVCNASCLHIITLVGVWSCIISLVPHTLAPDVTHHTTNGAICGKYKFC